MKTRFWLVGLFLALLSGCGYNTLQSQDEQIKSAWSEILNQYHYLQKPDSSNPLLKQWVTPFHLLVCSNI